MQITTLINHKDKPKRSDKTLQAIQRVGQAVNLAVGRFVTVGEAIANENHELKEEMSVACIEARRAGMGLLMKLYWCHFWHTIFSVRHNLRTLLFNCLTFLCWFIQGLICSLILSLT